ncbi:hypothetical protein EBB07_11365 [Paenibacillaceae bacterium]|nr:hypothetical protein EBB07_11365 [Paenibacillaceae bacterium]
MTDPGWQQHDQLIASTEQISELRKLRDRLQNQIEALLPSMAVEQYYTQLNGMHDALIKQAIVLSEAEMGRRGKGSPPVPYAYLLFGSGGRAEQTSSSDQDSGIIYGDLPELGDQRAVDAYFQELSDLIVQSLVELGYPPCDGNVISSDDRWRHSLSGWKAQLDQYFANPEWELVRHLLIVADGRRVYGSEELVRQLMDHFYSDMLRNPIIMRRMLDNTVRHKVLLGLFGQLLTEQYGEEAGSVDIKYGAYIPMVNAIRMMAVQSRCRATSTLARIAALAEAGVITELEAAIYTSVFRFFLSLRLMTTELTAEGHYANSGKLATSRLSKPLIEELKAGLRVGKKLQRRVYKQTISRL